LGPTEIAPEIMLIIKKIQTEHAKVIAEFNTCKLQFKALEGLRLDQIQEELQKHDNKLRQQQVYVQEYVDAVQMRIDECESQVRKYAAELVVDTEQIKEFTRKYVASYFEDLEQERENMATLINFIAESILLEQGISSAIMKAEKVKQKLNQGEKLAEILKKTFSNKHHGLMID
jgi:hypothetical protein